MGIRTLHNAVAFGLRMARQANLFAPQLQRIDRRTNTVVNPVAQPTKASHCMRSLPGLMQRAGKLHAIGWNEPRERQSTSRFAEDRSRKRNMPIRTRRQRVIAHHNETQRTHNEIATKGHL